VSLVATTDRNIREGGKPVMKLLNLDKSTLMEVTALEREDSQLIIRGTILGSMPVTCALTPSEVRAAFGLMDFKTLMFLMTMVFRA
jgi:hypothetical protein